MYLSTFFDNFARVTGQFEFMFQKLLIGLISFFRKAAACTKRIENTSQPYVNHTVIFNSANFFRFTHFSIAQLLQPDTHSLSIPYRTSIEILNSSTRVAEAAFQRQRYFRFKLQPITIGSFFLVARLSYFIVFPIQILCAVVLYNYITNVRYHFRAFVSLVQISIFYHFLGFCPNSSSWT